MVVSYGHIKIPERNKKFYFFQQYALLLQGL